MTSGAIQLNDSILPDPMRMGLARLLIDCVHWGDIVGSHILSMFTALLYWCLM